MKHILCKMQCNYCTHQISQNSGKETLLWSVPACPAVWPAEPSPRCRTTWNFFLQSCLRWPRRAFRNLWVRVSVFTNMNVIDMWQEDEKKNSNVDKNWATPQLPLNLLYNLPVITVVVDENHLKVKERKKGSHDVHIAKEGGFDSMHDLYLILVHCFVCFVPNLFNQMSRRSLDHTVYCPVQSYLRNICAKSIRIKSNVYRVSQKKRLEGHRLRNSANQPSTC